MLLRDVYVSDVLNNAYICLEDETDLPAYILLSYVFSYVIIKTS